MVNYKNKSLWRFMLLSKRYDIETLLKQLQHLPVPKRILFWKLDKKLVNMTLKQRFELIDRYKDGDYFMSTFGILTKIPKPILYLTPVKYLFPYVNAVIKDLENRAERDKQLEIPLTPEEKKAGIDKINHGIFGMINNIVQVTNGVYKHEDVENLSDNMVYAILKIEVDRNRIQRKLTEIYANKK